MGPCPACEYSRRMNASRVDSVLAVDPSRSTPVAVGRAALPAAEGGTREGEPDEFARLHHVIDMAGYHATNTGYAALHADVAKSRAFVTELARLRPSPSADEAARRLREAADDDDTMSLREEMAACIWRGMQDGMEKDSITTADAFAIADQRLPLIRRAALTAAPDAAARRLREAINPVRLEQTANWLEHMADRFGAYSTTEKWMAQARREAQYLREIARAALPAAPDAATETGA